MNVHIWSYNICSNGFGFQKAEVSSAGPGAQAAVAEAMDLFRQVMRCAPLVHMLPVMKRGRCHELLDAESWSVQMTSIQCPYVSFKNCTGCRAV